MPLFFFQIEQGTLYSDEHGTDLPNVAAAKQTAMNILCEVMRGSAEDLWRAGAFRLIAEDQHRQPLFALELSATDASQPRTPVVGS